MAGDAANEGPAVIVPDSASGAFVAFVRRSLSNDLGQVAVQSFDGQGQPRWPLGGAGAATTRRNEFHFEPCLLADSAGGVFVCFGGFDDAGDTSAWTIRCQHFDAAGRRAWGPLGVEVGGTAGSKVLPRAVTEGAGGLLVFWLNLRDLGGRPVLVEGQRLDGDGRRLWGSAGRTVYQTRFAAQGHGTYEYSAVTDGRAGAVVVFRDVERMPGQGSDVLAQRMTAEGVPLWGGGVVVAGGPRHELHEATVAAGDGGAFVVTTSHGAGSPRSEIRAHRLAGDGSHLWPAEGVPLSDPTSTAVDYGAAAAFDGRTLWLAWTRQAVPDGPLFDARLARLGADGSRLDGASGAVLSDAPGGQFTRALAVSRTSGRVLVVWDDTRSGSFDNSDVYGGLVRLVEVVGPNPGAGSSVTGAGP